MTIGILYSEPGCGKSYGVLGFEEPIAVFDMENRLKPKIDSLFSDKLIDLYELKLYDSDYNEDQIGSFDAFVRKAKNIIELEPENYPRTVVIDGIGDLRDYAHAKWAKAKNRKQAVNPGDWEQVNNLVKDTLFPLINWSRVHQINLIMTSQMKDNYTVVERDGKQESAKYGRIPAHKEWAGYNVDFLIELWQPKTKQGKIIPGQYMATCVKSEVGSWEEDISGKSLYDVFIEKRLL
jgi:hypothetical protein